MKEAVHANVSLHGAALVVLILVHLLQLLMHKVKLKQDDVNYSNNSNIMSLYESLYAFAF